MTIGASPSDLLEAGQYVDWYPSQRELFLECLSWYYSPSHFLGISAATGSGKSLIALLLAKMTGVRTVILTATKGLQDQYLSLAPGTGLTKVVGRNNFPCLLDPNTTAEDGVCNLGLVCDLRDECPYRVQLEAARKSNLVITNYAYWLAQTNYTDGLGSAGLLVCVPGETLVTMSDGRRERIDDIVKRKSRERVRSVDLSTGRVVDSCISGWHLVECKVRLLRIETSVGFLDVTEDHEVWTGRGYVRARDIKKGDVLYADTLESRATGFGEPIGGRLPDAGSYCWGKPTIHREAVYGSEGVCGLEAKSADRLGEQGAKTSTQWWVGEGSLHVPNKVSARADAILSTLLPRWEEDRVTRMVGLGGCSGTGLVVHGRWVTTAELRGAHVNPQLWGRRECLGLFPRVPSFVPQGVGHTVGSGAAEVLEVEEVEAPRYVYDITVENTHNFFANGHLVRNCDEGHLAFEALVSFLTVYIARSEIQPLGISFPSPGPSLWQGWRLWAGSSVDPASQEAQKLGTEVRAMRHDHRTLPSALIRAARRATALVSRLKLLSSLNDEWIVQWTLNGCRFVPKWVASHSADLFHPDEVPKIVLMSAILSHRTLDYLGVPKDNRTWLEAESQFPPENTPIVHVDTARINYRTGAMETRLWVSRIDQIIQRRLDRKGIIFTVSYERAKLLMSKSRFSDIMITHGTGDITHAVDTFKSSPPPIVLVSPSVTTGWDFPMQEKPYYLIVGKLPYPDTSDPVARARHEDDKDWSSYIAMETLIQESGRATRGVEERSEVIILDDNIRWFMKRYGTFAPTWFRARYRGSLTTVPDPLV